MQSFPAPTSVTTPSDPFDGFMAVVVPDPEADAAATSKKAKKKTRFAEGLLYPTPGESMPVCRLDVAALPLPSSSSLSDRIRSRVEVDRSVVSHVLPATDEILFQVGKSFALRHRHLPAVTLHALRQGCSYTAATKAGPRDLADATAFIRENLGYAPTIVNDPRDRCDDGARRPHHAAAILNLVLEAYLQLPIIVTEPTFSESTTHPEVTNELYGEEMHGCVWRLAIECVKERQFSLAEALFTMHFLLEHPDLYLLFFEAECTHGIREVLDTVAAAADPRSSGTSLDNINVGRMWAGLYARRLLFLGEAEYVAALNASTPADPQVIEMLLGLNETQPVVVQGGCTPHLLEIETNRTFVPLCSVNGLNMIPEAGAFESVVLQSHALRLAHKPFVDQRWVPALQDRVDVSRAPPLRAPKATATAAAAATKESQVSAVNLGGSPLNLGMDVEPHMVPLSVVVRNLATVSALRMRQSKRPQASFVRYSTKPGLADLGGSAGVLKFFDRATHDALVLQGSSHGNFYATIECGRLMAMLHNVATKRHTMPSFATAYMKECAQLKEIATANIKLEKFQHSWSEAAGTGRRDPMKEQIGNNIIAGDAVVNVDRTLHRVICAAVAAGMLELPSAVTTHTEAAKPSARITVSDANRAAATAMTPLIGLSRFHPPMRAGCGTPTTPHVGIASAVNGCAVGDSVVLLEGLYKPALLREVRGSPGHEIVVAPAGYTRLIHDKVGEERQLTPEERSSLPRCIVAHSSTTGADPGPLVTFNKCGFVQLCGLELRRTEKSVQGLESTHCELRHCRLVCNVPYSSDSECHVSAATNDIVSNSSALSRMWHGSNFPAWVIFVGYFFAVSLFVFFAFFSLFLTSALSDSDATSWIVRSVIATAAIAVIVEPATLAATATFSFANSVVFAAMSQLRAFIPV